jgi:hypothetical protein
MGAAFPGPSPGRVVIWARKKPTIAHEFLKVMLPLNFPIKPWMRFNASVSPAVLDESPKRSLRIL